MVPLVLNLKGKLVVVIGGGSVGRRKAAALREGGAWVRLVCLEPCPPLEMVPDLEWRTEPYRPDHLEGAVLVVAAGPAEVNRRVVADARARGQWLNVADDPAASDFFLPAVLRRGDFTLAVGTGGAAPGLARQVRARLESQFDEAFDHWMELLAELRPMVLRQIADPARRKIVLDGLYQWEWLERLRREDAAAVQAAMKQSFVMTNDEIRMTKE